MNGRTRQWARMVVRMTVRDWERCADFATGGVVALILVLAGWVVKAVVEGGIQ